MFHWSLQISRGNGYWDYVMKFDPAQAVARLLMLEDGKVRVARSPYSGIMGWGKTFEVRAGEQITIAVDGLRRVA